MPPAILPANEPERLAVLRRYHILDTPREEDFDDFTRLAAAICDTPMACISLIDTDRQWFKSTVGIAETETARDVSFCAHAILSPEVLEVANASEDPRFRDNPLVTSSAIQFYAGAPLLVSTGECLGTLCVVDRVPRQLSATQREALAKLARQVVHLLELRRVTRVVHDSNMSLESLISERTQTLTETQRRHTALLSRLQGAAYRCRNDLNRSGLFFSEGTQHLLGYTPEMMINGQVVYGDLVHPADRNRVFEGIRTATLQDAPFSLEYRVQRADGEWRWVRDQGAEGCYEADGEKILEGFISDIHAQKLADEQLRLSEFSVNRSSLATYWTDPVGRILRVNAEACRILGFTEEELLGMSVTDLRKSFEPSQWRTHWEKVKEQKRINFECEFQRKDGAIIPAEIDANWMEFEGQEYKFTFFRDITERKAGERQNLRTQRLESIGTLAGGVAHDLNNALSPIVMGVELLRLQFPTAAPILDTIDMSARRGAEMVRQLLTFAKGTDGERWLLQPKYLLEEVQKIILSTFPKNIELRTHMAANQKNVVGDTTQLHQVLVNLCVNARDAMPEGGVLTLDAQNVEVDESFVTSFAGTKAGSYVRWRISDTGSGIPAEILDRIFEPFFTTKGPEKGTGLGLSTVMGIVKSHSGFIHVTSEVNQGSCFEVYLPADLGDAHESEEAKQSQSLEGQGETLLLVDDEISIRQITKAVLERMNFHVLTAADGAEALLQVAAHRESIRAIVTDVHMANIDGLTFVRVLRRMLPEVPVIVLSGHLEPQDLEEFQELQVQEILSKPVTQSVLLGALRNCLEAGLSPVQRPESASAERIERPNTRTSHGLPPLGALNSNK